MDEDGITIATAHAAIIVEPSQGVTIRFPDGEITLAELADLAARRPRRRPPRIWRNS
jgi:hypothetical protein